jgi:hypothetical protein
MGTSWGIRCLNCGENACIDDNHVPPHFDTIQLMVEHAAKLAALPDMFGLDVTFTGVSAPLRWLKKHAGHQLRPVSEYGEIDGTCTKDFKCDHCGSRLGSCDKDVDHTDPCGKRGVGS